MLLMFAKVSFCEIWHSVKKMEKVEKMTQKSPEDF